MGGSLAQQPDAADHLRSDQRTLPRSVAALTSGLAIAVMLACQPFGSPSTVVVAPSPTPEPTPTWTPIPLATPTVTPTPTPTPTATPVPTPTSTPTTGVVPPSIGDATPPPIEGGSPDDRYTDIELLARLPTEADLALGDAYAYESPDTASVTAEQLNLAGQFLDPVVIRREDPVLLAMVFVGQASERVEQLVLDEILANPTDVLSGIATGLVEGLAATEREGEVQELEVIDGPAIGDRSAGARTRVIADDATFEAQLRIAVRERVIGLVIQITRVEGDAELVDANAILNGMMSLVIPRG